MAMVDVDGSCHFQVGWLMSGVGGHPVLGLHSSNEPGKLLQ